jgi:TPR repeat protein
MSSETTSASSFTSIDYARRELLAAFPALRAALVAGLMATVLLGAAACRPYEDGFEAYQRGDYTTAMRLVRPLADQGNAKAQEMVGSMYEQGWGVPQNYAEAEKWYRKAADQGNATAQVILDVMYHLLSGRYERGQNYAEAAKWHRKAADRGDAFAQVSLGSLYEQGRGVPQNYAEAVKWYRKAAEQGDAESNAACGFPSPCFFLATAYETAQFSLGSLYEQGRGVPQNYAEAVKWYRKAAKRGYAAAQCNLALMYDQGKGVPQNYTEAAKWYRKAADRGAGIADPEVVATAQVSLASMYEHGQGVPQDYVQAHMWYNLAASGSASERQIRRIP